MSRGMSKAAGGPGVPGGGVAPRKDPLHIPWAYSLAGELPLPLTGDVHPLRREAGKWLGWGSAVTIVLGLALFGFWSWWQTRQPELPRTREVRLVRYTELGVPPSIAKPSVPQINVQQEVAAAVAPPSIGVPEPVADEVATAPTIATIAEMSEALEPITVSGLGSGGGDSLVVEMDVERSPAPDEFVAVEEEPVRISIDPPVYPGVAVSAGVEGTVVTRVLVGKDGKVKDVIVMEGHELLKEAAKVCAKTAVFRPALMSNRPIEVWVLMPITFQIKGQ